MRKRDPNNNNNNILKDLIDWRSKHHYKDTSGTSGTASSTRIIVKKNSEGKYIIDKDLNKVELTNECKRSVQDWLLNHNGTNFSTYPPDQKQLDEKIKLLII